MQPGVHTATTSRSTQPSIPLELVNQVPACLAGVKVGPWDCSLVSGGTFNIDL